MKFCFIGLGSIAKRHIHNLKFVLKEKAEIEVLRSGSGKLPVESVSSCIDRVCYSEGELAERYDAIFITNPTSLHYKTLKQYLHLSKYFFIEKPVFETGEEDISAFLETDKVFYVACPLRYTNVIRYLKNNVDFSKVHSMRCISSSYLPDWRSGTDYRNTYSAHKDMGGGVSIDLIHEWDYIHYLTGSPKSVQSIIRKKSALEIDSDDIAVYIAEYEDKVVELHLDYFGRSTIRRAELYMDNDTIFADLIDQKIRYLKSGQIIELSQGRNDFQIKELKHFIEIMQGKISCDNNLLEACSILKIARGMK